VIILEIDKELVGICAEHMPEWSYCGDIDRGGSDVTTSCFDDPRARVMYADAFDWFVDRFGNDAAANREDDGEKFDVIIMDSLDPKTSLEIAGGLYDSTSFVDSLFNGLTEKGVVRSLFGIFCKSISSP
jgi:spermidine synthase